MLKRTNHDDASCSHTEFDYCSTSSKRQIQALLHTTLRRIDDPVDAHWGELPIEPDHGVSTWPVNGNGLPVRSQLLRRFETTPD